MSNSTVTLIVIGAAVVLFASGRLAPEIVGVGTALVLYAAGVITADQTAAGFGDPAVVFIASLFVVGEALDSSGVTAWAGETLIAKVGSRLRALLVAMLFLAAVLSALLTPNGSVAALIPVGVVMARRIGLAPSRLLIQPVGPMPWRSRSGLRRRGLGAAVLDSTPWTVLAGRPAHDVTCKEVVSIGKGSSAWSTARGRRVG